jgi:phosphatidylglycerophosphate synthase
MWTPGEPGVVKHGFVLTNRSRGEATAAWALLPVAGMPLILRQTRLVRGAGVGSITVVCHPDDQSSIQESLVGRFCIDDVQVTAALDQDETMRILVEGLDTSPDGAIVLDGRFVVERGALSAMIENAVEGAPLTGAFVGAEDERASPTGIIGLAQSPEDDVRRWLRSWLQQSDIPFPTEARRHIFAPQDFVGMVSDSESARDVNERLWEGCRKAADGLVSRNLNRHISLFVSRRIVGTGFSPNQVTLFNLLFGIGGAVCALAGDAASIFIGATLLQLNSILDGVDGELARMRIQSSVLGEWLDTVSDDIANQGFFACLAIGTWRMTSEEIWLWLGVATVIPLMATSAFYYIWCWRQGRGDILAFDWFDTAKQAAQTGIIDRIVSIFTVLFRRDSFVMMIWVAAAFGVAQFSLWITAPAAILTACSLWLSSSPVAD